MFEFSGKDKDHTNHIETTNVVLAIQEYNLNYVLILFKLIYLI